MVCKLGEGLTQNGVGIFLETTRGDFAKLLFSSVSPGKHVIIHDHGLWLRNNHKAAVIAFDHRVPRIVSPRGMLEPWARQHHATRKRIAWALYQRRDLKRADALHATSQQEAETLRDLGFAQPIAIVANGIVSRTDPLQRKPPDRERLALFLSRVHPKKGLFDLVEAWHHLRPQGWRVQIVGPDEGGHRAQVMRRVEELGLMRSFEFLEQVAGQTKEGLYKAADLFILPSYSENFGNVVGEALSFGLPVITTTATPWSALETHQCGWWIRPGVSSLVSALGIALSLSDADRWEMGSRGRKLVRDSLSWATIGLQMAEVYQWVLGGGDQPSHVI